MEIKTIEQIKEEEAINHGWENYNHALDAANAGVISGFSFADLWEDVAIQYASQFQTNTDLITTEICVLRERVSELEGVLEKCRLYFSDNGNQYHKVIDSLINKGK